MKTAKTVKKKAGHKQQERMIRFQERDAEIRRTHRIEEKYTQGRENNE